MFLPLRPKTSLRRARPARAASQKSQHTVIVIHDGAEKVVPYTLVRTPGQKSIRLSVNEKRGFLLSCPARTPQEAISAFLAQHAAWIARHAAEYERRSEEKARLLLTPITHFEFALTGETFEVERVYRETTRPCAKVMASATRVSDEGAAHPHARTVRLTLPLSCERPCSARAFAEAQQVTAKALKRFVKREALMRLTLFAVETAAAAGIALAPTDVRISDAHARWGSCSSRGKIMLSTRVLFLPVHLARHVVLHELAHLAHLDHSAAFHQRLLELDRDAQRHARELSGAGSLVPWWMDARP